MRRQRIVERARWREQAESLGFVFHTIDGEAYWDESVYYAFTLRQIENDLEDPSAELHAMAMDLAADVVRSGELMAKLGIPPAYWDWIADSLQRQQPHLYGRMDLAYDGHGPAKLYEFNYDTPTSLYEAAYFQWLWLEDQIAAKALPAGADQFNRIQDALIERFASLLRDGRISSLLHLAAVADSREDIATTRYIQDCAHQAGLETRLLAMENIGLTADGRFTDLDDDVIAVLFKLYPLEDLMRDAFGRHLPSSGVQLIEPAWKAVLSNKGILPLLWDRHRGHPNLLEARFADGEATPSPGWVRKPIHSREGANIMLRLASGERVDTDGPYTGPAILQAAHPLTEFDGAYPLIGSWVVGNDAVGIGIREDASLITRDTARFVPHAIIG